MDYNYKNDLYKGEISMETIIHQIMQSVLQTILKRIQEQKTLDEWATETLEDCKAMAIEIAQEGI